MLTIDKLEITKSEAEVAKELRDLFIDIGVNYRSKGFKYLITACVEVIFNPEIMNTGITKALYPDLANFYNTRCGCIERCIRSSIENIDLEDNPRALSVFGNIKKLTNSIFISAVSDYIRVNSI